MKIHIPTIFFTASSIKKTRAFLSTYSLTSTRSILLIAQVLPISNFSPSRGQTGRLSGIVELPRF